MDDKKLNELAEKYKANRNEKAYHEAIQFLKGLEDVKTSLINEEDEGIKRLVVFINFLIKFIKLCTKDKEKIMLYNNIIKDAGLIVIQIFDVGQGGLNNFKDLAKIIEKVYTDSEFIYSDLGYNRIQIIDALTITINDEYLREIVKHHLLLLF